MMKTDHKNTFDTASKSRRDFIKQCIWGSAVFALGFFHCPGASAQNDPEPHIGAVIIDYNRCTGCRTCETVCAQYNHPVATNGKNYPGLGNPFLSNIRVHAFHPNVDVPVVCLMCEDAPCIAACPVKPDSSGNRALYRDPKLLTIRNDPKRCVGCGECAKACQMHRVGAIVFNRETRLPERLCTLCDGTPQCVEYCPYGAISFVVGGVDTKHYAASPNRIAQDLTDRWYNIADSGYPRPK